MNTCGDAVTLGNVGANKHRFNALYDVCPSVKRSHAAHDALPQKWPPVSSPPRLCRLPSLAIQLSSTRFWLTPRCHLDTRVFFLHLPSPRGFHKVLIDD